MSSFLHGLDQTDVIDITQNHLKGKTNKDVEFLDLSEQNFETLPRGIENFFPNLVGIRAYRNNLKRITKDDLKGYKNLKYLNLYNNDITTVESDLFSLSPKLQYINFGNNFIRNVARNAFNPLKNLQQLYFHDGKMCINEHASTRDEIASLLSNLFVKCPPTYEMFMKDIWEDENFVGKIDGMIQKKVEDLEKKIMILEGKIGIVGK